MQPSVCVVGMGVVGSAVYQWFAEQGHPTAAFDPPKRIGSPEEVERAELLFICVPTPYVSGDYDTSALENVLAAIPGHKNVVVKSTVLPGTTEGFQRRFPQHRLMFNPEFLTAAQPFRDFIDADRQIVGFTRESRDVADDVLRMLPNAPLRRLMPASEAEMIKCAANAFLSLKVIYANQLYDVCVSSGLNYDLVREGVAGDVRIGASHLNVMDGGYRGYGGQCLPKDTKALIDFARQRVGAPMRLLEEADAINDVLVGQRSAAGWKGCLPCDP